MSSFVVSNQTQLNKALGAARGGDSIILASSFKNANVQVVGFNKPGGLTIMSDGDGQATVSTLRITNSSGITVRNVDVPQAAQASQTVSVVGSSNIELSGLHIHGVADLTKTGVGMTIRNSTSVTLHDSVFDHLNGGLYVLDNIGLTLERNRFSEIVNDGFIGSRNSYLTIKDNYFTNWQHFGDIHADAIQLYTRSGDPVSHDITITGNVYNRGTGTAIQAIWVRNDAGTAPFENVAITNNTIIGATYNAIGLVSVGTAVVSGNLVQGYDNQQSRIAVADTRGSVTVTNNTATWFTNGDSHTTFSGNTVTSYLPSASLSGITSAIAAFAGSNLADAAASVQRYLASISSSMAASNLPGGSNSPGLPVVGTVAELLAHPDLVRAWSGRISGDNSVTVSEYNILTALGRMALAPGATVTLHGTAAELLAQSAYNATHSPFVTNVVIEGDGVVAAGQATMLAGLNHVSLDPGAHLGVNDWAVNVNKNIDALERAVAQGLVTSITVADKAPLFGLTDTQYLNDADVLGMISTPSRQNVTVAAGHSITARDAGAQLDGSAGNAVLHASDKGNTLIGGAGDTLIGGLGKDTFVLHGHFGAETVIGFGTGDVLQLDKAMVSDFRHLVPSIHQVGQDVVIDLGAGDILTLADTNIASLASSNFRFY